MVRFLVTPAALVLAGALSAPHAQHTLEEDVNLDWAFVNQGVTQPGEHAGRDVDARGNLVAVIGNQSAGDVVQLRVRALEADTGLERWSAAITGVDPDVLVAQAVGISPAGDRVYAVANLRESGAGLPYQLIVVAYDALTGAELWTGSFVSPAGSAVAADAAVLPDGSGLVVTGQVFTDLFAVRFLADGTVGWDVQLDGPDGFGDKGFHVVADAAGQVYVGADSVSLQNGTDVWLLAFAADTGALVWELRYPSAAFGSSLGGGLAVGPGGGRLIAAAYQNPSGVVLGVAGATGTLLWTAGFGTRPLGVDLSPDGLRVAVIGRTETFDRDYLTECYDAFSGASQWTALYASPPPGDNDWPYFVRWLADSSAAIVSGESEGAGFGSIFDGPDDLATVAYRAADGAELWVHRHEPPDGNADPVGLSVTQTAAGPRVVVAGTSRDGPAGEVHALALEPSTGSQPWLDVDPATISKGFAQGFDAVVLAPDGATAWVGATSEVPGPGLPSQMTVRAVDAADGSVLWAVSLGSLQGPLEALALAPDGATLYALHGTSAFVVRALNAATGDELWMQSWPGTGDAGATPRALAVAADGARVYAAGFSSHIVNLIQGLFRRSLSVVALDAAGGAVAWGADHVFVPGVDSWAEALAAAPDGSRVFAVGGTDDGGPPGTGTDLAAVAFDAASGTLAWAEAVDGGALLGGSAGTDEGRAALAGPGGQRLYVTGRLTSGTNPNPRFASLALAMLDGSLQWVDPGDPLAPPSANAWGADLALAPDSSGGSRLFAAGQDGVAGQAGVLLQTVALDAATGARLWAARDESPGSGFATAVGATSDGRTAVVTGTVEEAAPGEKTWRTLAYHAQSGVELWRGDYDGADQLFDGVRDLAVGDGFALVAGWTSAFTQGQDAALLRYGHAPLLGGPPELPLALGGTHELLLDAGLAQAAAVYLVLGSVSGTEPGFPIDGFTLPLNVDAYTFVTLLQPSSALLPGSLGLLDGAGQGAAALVAPPGLSPALAGTTVHHAFVAFTGAGAVGFASQASPVVLEL